MRQLFTLRRMLVFLVFVCCAGNAQAQGKPVGTYPDSLKAIVHIMDDDTYKLGGNLFLKLFRVNDTPSKLLHTFDPSEIYEVTTKGEFKALEKACDTLIKAADKGKNFTAFRIKYGLRLDAKTGKYKQVFIYIPLVMNFIGTNSDSMDMFKPEPDNSTKESKYLYILENKKFVHRNTSAEIKETLTWINNYKEHIRLDADNDSNFRKHNGDTINASGDALSAIYTFWQIEYFFSKYSGDIYIGSYGAHAARHGVDMFKHFVAFSDTPYDSATIKSRIADLGTMCPPNCLKMVVDKGIIKSREDTSSAPSPSPSPAPSPSPFPNTLIWILIAAGCLLIGFVIARLMKK